MKEDDTRKGTRANTGENSRERMRDSGEYFDPNEIPPEKLIPYTDSLIFSLVMRDEDICRGVLQAILPEEDFGEIHIKSPENLLFADDDAEQETQQESVRVETEKTLKYGREYHGVRFDAQLRSTKRWASVEMQTYRDHLGKRSRDYHANMDLEALDAGDDYRKLPRSFVIFICTYDYLKVGEPMYRFQSYDVKNRLPLDDESYTIILNTACEPEKVPEELRAFFAYINDPSKRDGSWLTQAIDERVRKYNTTKWRKRQMTLEEMMNQRFDAGREEGIGIGREEGIGIGREEGEEKLNRLNMLLIRQDRMEDLKKAAEDKEYRRRLYREFGLDAETE